MHRVLILLLFPALVLSALGCGGGGEPPLMVDPLDAPADPDDGIVIGIGGQMATAVHGDPAHEGTVRRNGSGYLLDPNHLVVGRADDRVYRAFVGFDVTGFATADWSNAYLELTVEYTTGASPGAANHPWQRFGRQGMLVEYLDVGPAVTAGDFDRPVPDDDIQAAYRELGIGSDHRVRVEVTDALLKALAKGGTRIHVDFRMQFPDADVLAPDGGATVDFYGDGAQTRQRARLSVYP